MLCKGQHLVGQIGGHICLAMFALTLNVLRTSAHVVQVGALQCVFEYNICVFPKSYTYNR